MKTPEQLATSALKHSNWTKLTLEELFMCGRIFRSDDKAVMGFLKAANGQAENLQDFKNYKQALQIIQTS